MDEQNQLNFYGWHAHYVPAGDNTPFGANYHTHGFPEKYNHPDIQICFPLPIDVANGYFSKVAKFLSHGSCIEVGKMYDWIIRGYFVQFIEAYESDRKVLRMILPDINGSFDTDPYRHQFENIFHSLNDRNL